MNQHRQTVFVETSVQIQRVLAPPGYREQIRQELASSTMVAVSSHYVWMEYQRTIIADHAHVHDIMGNHTDWGSLFGHVLDGQRAFRPRSAVRCTQIISQAYHASDQRYELGRQFLSIQVSHNLRQIFWTDVTAVHNTIVCDLVESGIVRSRDGTYAVAASCRKESAACRLPDFLTDQRTKLNAMADYLAVHPRSLKNQVKVQQLLAAILQDPRNALGQTSCWPLGDIIIALQVPAGAALWTLDADFAPLAAALDIPLYQPTFPANS